MGVSTDDLANPNWEMQMLAGEEPPQHRLVDRLISDGFVGLIVPSFARGAGAGDINVVFWSWEEAGGASVTVMDEEGRIPKDSGGSS